MLARMLKEMFGRAARDRSRCESALATARSEASAGNFGAAIAALEALAPRLRGTPRVVHAEGLIAFQRGDLARALRLLEEAAAQLPEDSLVLANLAAASCSAGRLGEAESALRRSLDIDPANALSWSSLAQVLLQRGRRGEAIDAAQRAEGLRPDDAQVQHILGMCLLAKSLPRDALVHLRRAIKLDAGQLGARFHAARAAALACDWSWPRSDTVALIEHWSRNPADPRTETFQPFLAYEVPVDAAVRLAVAQHYANRFLPETPPPRRPPTAARGRLRVGYLSADFHNHPTMHLAAGLFEQHDRARFEVFAYSFGEDDGSAYRQRAHAAIEHFVDVRDEAPAQTAARIGRDGIQVLVDLKGFTYLARPGILGLRPAPVQAAYLGYPGTMGRGLVDYLVSDRIVTPPGCEAAYGECLALIPGSYQVNDSRQPVAPQAPTRTACGLPESALVLACFNVLYKIDARVFDAWTRILRALPDAVLWLLAKPEHAQESLRREARERGLDPARLVFAPFASKPEHLARLANADLCLDTLFVNGHTSASDALRAGVPVLTCAGDSFAARVAASLVHAADVGEMAVDTLEAYEQLAIALGRDRGRLRAVRARLRAGRASCALFDTQRTTRNLERAYALMWEIHVQGSAPCAFSVLSP